MQVSQELCSTRATLCFGEKWSETTRSVQNRRQRGGGRGTSALARNLTPLGDSRVLHQTLNLVESSSQAAPWKLFMDVEVLYAILCSATMRPEYWDLCGSVRKDDRSRRNALLLLHRKVQGACKPRSSSPRVHGCNSTQRGSLLPCLCLTHGGKCSFTADPRQVGEMISSGLRADFQLALGGNPESNERFVYCVPNRLSPSRSDPSKMLHDS